MTASPVVLNDTIPSHGSRTVLAGNPTQAAVKEPTGNPVNHHGCDDLHAKVMCAGNTPATLNRHLAALPSQR